MSESAGFNHFKFMYQRFLTSTLGWKEEEQGAYMRLLIIQFDQGGIPADLDAIREISPVARKIWTKKLSRKFRHVNEDGTLYNSVMKGVRDEAIEVYAKNVSNGKKGGRPKKNPTVSPRKPNGFETETQRFPPENPTGNPNERQPVTSNQKPIEEKIEKENWNYNPGPDVDIELTEMEIGMAVEWVAKLKQATLSTQRVNDFWAAFKLKLTRERFYPSRSDLLSHFRNWLKDQDHSAAKASFKNDSTAAAPLKII